MLFEGKAIKYGDGISTDDIVPGEYLGEIGIRKKSEWGSVCFKTFDPGFLKRVNKGSFLVAGHNFGCGSSREVAPLAIKESGISCVLAKSFGRIFFRNAINIGLFILECDSKVVDSIEEGDLIRLDTNKNELFNCRINEQYKIPPLPEFFIRIIDCNGLIEFSRRRLENRIKGD